MSTIFHSARQLGLGLVVCLALALATDAGAELVNRIVAVVNGEMITALEVDRGAAPVLARAASQGSLQGQEENIRKLKENVLDQLINNVLIEQEAERLGIEVTDTEIDTQIQQVKSRRQMTQEDLENQLKADHKTMAEYRDQLKKEIMRHKLLGLMVRRQVLVTNEEIQAYYDEHKGEYSTDRAVELALIVLPSGEDAQAVRDRILTGKLDFAEAAKTLSVGPRAEQGGDIGRLKWADLAQDWRDALKGVTDGGVSRVFSVQGRDALLLLQKLDEGTVTPLADVEDEIMRLLQAPLIEKKYEEYLGKLREKAVVDMRL